MRGYVRWSSQQTVPQPVQLAPAAAAPANTSLDSYSRITWTDLEGPTQGSYSFTATGGKIYDGIVAAKAAGGPKAKYAFRIRTMKDITDNQAFIPAYVRNSGPGGSMKGWNHVSGSNSTSIPDWNDAFFIARYNALLAAIAAIYDGSPDISYLDIGTYGKWGEWHLHQLTDPASGGYAYYSNLNTNGSTPATEASLRAYVDGYTAAFKKTRLVMMTDRAYALEYAMSLNPSVYGNPDTPWIGWRRDSTGYTLSFNGLSGDPVRMNAIANRWQKAPTIGEFFGPGNTNASTALSNVRDFHVSALGNGNLSSWSTYSSANQATFAQAGREAGYRLSLTNLRIPQALVSGWAFSVVTQWKNSGVTPVHEPFTVLYQLRTGSTVVREWASSLDFEDVNHTGYRNSGGTTFTLPAPHTDNLTMPSSVAPGSYDFVVILPALDCAREAGTGHYLPLTGSRYPLSLAITTSRNSTDGSYTLGTVTVVSGAPTITQQPLAQTITAGTPVTFSVTASGTALTYQWKKGGSNVSGATQSVYTIASVAGSHYGDYTCTVTNSGGSVTSNAARLSIAYLIDDLEDGDITNLAAWTSSVGSGPAVAISAVAVTSSELAAHSGSTKHAIVDFGTTATWKYAVARKPSGPIYGADWNTNAVTAIRFYLKGSTANVTGLANTAVKMQLREGDTGDRWSYNLGTLVNNNSGTWTVVSVPLSTAGGAFYSETGNPGDATFTLSAIDQIRFWDNAVSGQVKIRVDKIEVIRE